jgi:UDP-galactopyranose mutase
MKKILIVGSGLFGSVIARELTDVGYKCHVIDRRNHIGGNCYTENVNGINVHVYGAHVFHTSNDLVWKFLLKHTTINQFSLRMKLRFGDRLYSLPINLMTLNQLWNITTPTEAEKKITEVTKEYKRNFYDNAEEWALGNVGKEIYDIFYKQYLEKQWHKNPKEIPAEIIARQVIRMDYNDSYYYDIYQGMPDYTKLFNSLLKAIPVDLNVDYLNNKEYFNDKYDKIIYTGAIDEFFNYEFGALEYRSLKFENETRPVKDFQGVCVVSYPEKKYEFTRIIEHKHFEFGKQDFTIITREYPQDWKIGVQAYYPFNNNKNQIIYEKYAENVDNKKYIFGGRLGSYKYLNMDETVDRALTLANNFKYDENI